MLNDRNTEKTFEKKIAIYYKNIPWGYAQATVFIENKFFPPRKHYNDRFIAVEAEYAGKNYSIRCSKGGIDGALISMKRYIEQKLVKQI